MSVLLHPRRPEPARQVVMGVHQRFEHAVAALHHLDARRSEVRHDHYRDPCGLRCACAVLAVFKRQALCGVHAQTHSRQLVR